METKRFAYYREGKYLIGWLEECPDYWTQGETLDELQANLKDISEALAWGQLPYVGKSGSLPVL